MKVNRDMVFFLLLILLAGDFCNCDEEEKTTEPPKHENFPRVFRIFSRPADKSSEKQEGGSLLDHLGNVFKGGSIGFEAEGRPLAPFHDIIDKAKEFIPNPFGPGLSSSPIEKAKELFPIPFLPGLKPTNKDTDRKDTEVKPKPEEPWEAVEEPEKPKHPDNDDHKSESLGDDSDESDYVTQEPIENIIQPRIRQKRSPDSRVFHVPLQFLSNAKPFEVKIK